MECVLVLSKDSFAVNVEAVVAVHAIASGGASLCWKSTDVDRGHRPKLSALCFIGFFGSKFLCVTQAV